MVVGSSSQVSEIGHRLEYKLKWSFHFVGAEVTRPGLELIDVQLSEYFGVGVFADESSAKGDSGAGDVAAILLQENIVIGVDEQGWLVGLLPGVVLHCERIGVDSGGGFWVDD